MDDRILLPGFGEVERFSGLDLCRGDVDRYELGLLFSTLETSTELLMQVEAEPPGSTLNVRLLALDGAEVFAEVGAERVTFEDVFQPLSSSSSFDLGVFALLEITPGAQRPATGYSLKLRAFEVEEADELCLEELAEPNNLFSDAAPLEPGCRAEGSLCYADGDLFRVEVAPGEPLAAALYVDEPADPSIEPPSLQVYNSAMELLSEESGPCVQVALEGLEAGSYYLKVSSASVVDYAGGISAYALTYRLLLGGRCGPPEDAAIPLCP